MGKKVKILEDSFTQIEKNEAFSLYPLVYLLAIIIRSILQPFPNYQVFLYYNLFYLSVSGLFTIIIKLVTGHHLLTITKTIFTFVLLILIAPLVDVILLGGLETGHIHFLPKVGSAITLGVKLELIVMLTLIYAYVRIKTNSYGKALLTILLTSLVVLIFAFIPWSLAALGIKTAWPTASLQLILILLFGVLALYYYLYNKKGFQAIWHDLELIAIANYSGIFLLGTVLTKHHLSFSNFGLDLGLATSLLAIFSGVIFLRTLNNLTTYEIDQAVGNKTPLTSEAVPRLEYQLILLISLGYSLLTAFFSTAQGITSLLLMAAFNLTNYVYFVVPISKMIPVISKIYISACCVWMILYGYYFSQGTLAHFPALVIWYFLIFFTLALNFTDIKREKIDSYCCFFTLPTIIKMGTARKIIGLMLLTAFMLAPFVFQITFLFPLMLAIGLLEYYLIITEKWYKEERIFIIFIIVLYGVTLYFYYKNYIPA